MVTLDERKAMVARGYDRAAERYAGLEETASPWPRLGRLRALLARLPDGSPVLDVGCGNGAPALGEIARRHRATGIDISRAQVEAARHTVPEARVLEGDVMAVDLPDGSFDAVTAFYAVEHLPRQEHHALLGRLARWLRPGGLLLFTVEPDAYDDEVGRWLEVDMFLSCYDAATTLRLVEGAGLRVLTADVETQLEGGREVDYLWVLAEKPPDA